MHIKFFLSLIFALMLHAVPAFAMNCGTCNAAIEGKICYASDDKTLMLCNGSTWVDQSASCGLAMPSHSCGTCNTANNGKICYETTAGMTFFCNGESWRGTRLMTPAPATSLNACGYTERGVIGTWNSGSTALNVETRQFTRNGQNEWILTTTVPNSPIDKHYPRGDNFLASVTLNGSFNGNCLNGGETAWWGLSKPSGLTTPAHYEAGTEADGAEFFKHKSYCSTGAPVQCWGGNQYGGSTPSPTVWAKSITRGFNAMCAIKSDDTTQCWGYEPYNGGSTPSAATEFKSIVSTSFWSCGIRSDNSMQCWGGETGGFNVTGNTATNVKALYAGSYSVCAIKSNDTIQCWQYPDMWASYPAPSISAKSVAMNTWASCAVKLDNTVQCWGMAGFGGTTPSPAITVKSLYTFRNAAAICAIKTDDTVKCWGEYTAPAISAKSIAMSTVSACAIKMDNTVQCWGAASYGGTTPSPTISAKSITAGWQAMCAIKMDDTVQCWGTANKGGTTPSPTISAKFIAGDYFGDFCAIKMDDTLQCWGENSYVAPNINALSLTAGGNGNGAFCAIKK